MPKLAKAHIRPALPKGPMTTTTPTHTHEGGAGYALDVKTELFTLAVANFVSEKTFYESAETRDDRFAGLVRQAATEDPQWTAKFIGWLRSDANMRTASIVAACEYARAVPNSRRVISAACQRADEPAEVLSYWRGTYGRSILSAVKRGVADAATRLYNERSYVKWDSDLSPMRFADVIELTHPKPRNAPQAEFFRQVQSDQSALFRRALEDRHRRERDLTPVPGVDEYKGWIRSGAPVGELPAVATWENLSAHHKMDAASWEAVIPQMGYMALLRNLRNFERAGISAEATNAVIAKLSDPNEVARSRQLPFRFWSAHRNTEGFTYTSAIETALEHAVGNIPAMSGKTLVMVDVSGSMQSPLSARSTIKNVEAAALFGAATIAKTDGTLAVFATNWARVESKLSILRTTEKIAEINGVNGHGTNTWPCTAEAWKVFGPFDRVFVFTDMQAHFSAGADFIPRHVPVYTWDLGGYGRSHIKLGSGRYVLAGLSDQTFKLVEILERGLDSGWPWELSS